MTNNYELFQRDPKTTNLVNDGQARLVDESSNSQAMAMLRYELENFVCEGQYAYGLQRILDSFLSNIGSASQRASWVSGFYGSGKSHLLKMLGHLWVNTQFSDGTNARSLPPDIPEDIRAAFLELDNAGKRTQGGLFAVSGAMPEGSAESARVTVLGILFKACGLPRAYNHARFCLFLRDKGYDEAVRSTVAAAGKEFDRELADLYASRLIREALIKCDPDLGDASEVRRMLREQFPNVTDVDTSEFIRIAKEVLTEKGRGHIPLTVVILDEVQHYIGDSKDRSREITELTEALNKQMDSRVLVVAAGQNALSTDTPQFAWLRDRYTIRVELSDADVEAVTRKVLLKKKPEATKPLQQELDRNAGEIERQLVKSSIAPTTKDRDWLVPDYPILPTRRRFWEAALHAVDPSGSASLLRTQLRITHEALREVAEKRVGHVVPADFMFFQQQTGLVQQGVLSREVSDRILRMNDGSDDGRLRSRICGLVFLIRKLSREPGMDIGVRADEDMLADLLVEDLKDGGSQLRDRLPDHLSWLVDQGVLLYDGGEYNLQTKESAEWDDLFKTQLQKVRQDTSAVSQERKRRLQSAIAAALKAVRLTHGDSKVKREIAPHFGLEHPDETTGDIPVWIRDGWEANENDVVNAARAAGATSPTLFVFLGKSREDSFRENILRLQAAQAVLDIKGAPASREAEEARDAMESRRDDCERNINEIIRNILTAGKVFKGGSAELHALELADKVQDGSESALDRLFPKFGEADHKSWEIARRRASQGDDSPLAAVGWKGATADHPVCKALIREIGSGKEGRHLRAHFEKPPYGWPRDAIYGALICLGMSGDVLVSDSRTGEAIQPKHLDQNRIPKAKFRCESVTLSAKDRIALRGLFQAAGLVVKPDDDLNSKATEYLDLLVRLGQRVGGDAPLPERPSTTAIQDIRAKAGNDQLDAILKQKSTLQVQADDWKQLADLADKRIPAWQRLNTLLSAGVDLPELDDARRSAEAVVSDRLLLHGTDHLQPLTKHVADALRSSVVTATQEYADARAAEIARLEASTAWQELDEEQRKTILANTSIPASSTPSLTTEEELAESLAGTPLSVYRDRRDALASRVDGMIAQAAKLLEPKATRIFLPSATIHDENDLEAWLSDARERIQTGLEGGPVIL